MGMSCLNGISGLFGMITIFRGGKCYKCKEILAVREKLVDSADISCSAKWHIELVEMNFLLKT